MAQFQPVNLVRMKTPKPAVLPHGVSHQTPAVRHAHQLALGGKPSGTRKRRKSPLVGRKKKAKKIHAAPKHKRKSRTSAAAFVKGSPAARKHMAKLRAMRGKKAAA
jgi:hypothetical protein